MSSFHPAPPHHAKNGGFRHDPANDGAGSIPSMTAWYGASMPLTRSALVFALVGCGGDRASEPIVIHTAGTALAAVQHDEGGAWMPLQPDAAGEVLLSVDGPVTIATVCALDGFFDFYAVKTGPGAPVLEMSCTDAAATVDITIAAPPETEVYLGFTSIPGGLDAPIEAGTYDVVAIDRTTTPPRFEIRREVPLTTHQSLSFDLATTGTAMRPATLEVTNLDATETASQRTSLYTARRTFISTRVTGPQAWLFPASAMIESDRQLVGVSASRLATGTRSARRKVTGDEATVPLTLPAYLGPVATQWDATPKAAVVEEAAWTEFYFGVNAPDYSVLWDVAVTSAWLEAGGAGSPIEIPEPTAIPGWDPAWTITDHTGFEWHVSASRSSGADLASASRTGTF